MLLSNLTWRYYSIADSETMDSVRAIILTICCLTRIVSSCLQGCVCDHSTVTCSNATFENFPLQRLPAETTSFILTRSTKPNLNLNYASGFATLHGTNFSNLPHLVHLTLTQAGIKGLIGEPFLQVTRLQSLNLSHNYIQQLSAGVFNGASNHLRFLDLSHNYLTDLSDPDLFYLPHLKYLSLASNNLNVTSWTNIFSKTHAVETLILDGIYMPLAKGIMFNYLNRLSLMSLKNCNISSVDIDFHYFLPSLVTLDLQWNAISEMTSLLFSNPSNLAFLYLDHNLIDSIPTDSLPGLNIHTLSLSFNNILRVSTGAFLDLHIKDLNLSHNKLNLIPNDTFASIGTTLHKLSLSSNNIQHDLNITDLTLLTDLNLSDNALSVIPESIHYLLHLKSLDLSYNQLLTLTYDDLQLILRLDYVDLYNITWFCECKLFEFHQQLVKYSKHGHLCGNRNLHNSNSSMISNHSSLDTSSKCIICSGPSDLASKSLTTLAIDLQQCAVIDKDNLLGLYILCGVILFLVVLLLVFMWTRRKEPIPGSSSATTLIGRDRRSSWIWEILTHKKSTVIENSAVAGCSNEFDKNKADDMILTISGTTAEHTNKNLQVYVEPSSELIIISNPIAICETLATNGNDNILDNLLHQRNGCDEPVKFIDSNEDSDYNGSSHTVPTNSPSSETNM